MKSTTIRIFVLLAIASLVGVVIVQYYWFDKAFDYQEQDLNHRITLALQSVAEKIVPPERRAASFFQPVEQLSSNYFNVMVNDAINPEVLREFLKLELVKQEVGLDFEYAIYDCTGNSMQYCEYICLSGDCAPPASEQARFQFPELARADGYYFGVYFPHKGVALSNQMGIWLFSTIVVLIVILFFSYSLFVILRQRRLSEIQKDFINNMTHEFKTPLSTIDISTSVLMQPAITGNPERLLSYATIIKNETTRLKNQVEKVLQVAVMDNRSEDLKMAPVHLNDLIRQLKTNLEAKLEQHHARLDLLLNAENDCLEGDTLHLTNIFNNMIDNSLKYCEHERPHIVIGTEYRKGQLTVTVQDNGIGIGEKDRKMIFNKFYRVSTGDVHNVKGFGLGLHYVKMIVEAHKGHIGVSSRPGEGTLFTLVFKALPGKKAPQAPSPIATEAPKPARHIS
jgi:two-component system phosphate regulon sensor histidine kinase PhoR